MNTNTQITLRPYQDTCIERVLTVYQQQPSGGKALLVLPTGCHRAGQGILMYDGTIKPVEEIQVGDLLMGPDSTPRQVMALCRGSDEMIEVRPTKGTPWVVNKAHVLSLVHTNERNGERSRYPSARGGDITDVSVAEWFTWSRNKKHVHKLFRVGVDFPVNPSPLPLHPYLLGVLLGDGGLSIAGQVHLTNIDKEVIKEVERIQHSNGLMLRPLRQEDRAQSYALTGRIGSGRPKESVQTVKRIVSKLGLLPIRSEDRFIPHIFKSASRQDRLELLAGLLDTDGSQHGNGFDFLSKSQQLANDVAFVARSLGLAAYQSTRLVIDVTYYRISLSGDCSVIPTRIARKHASVRTQKKNVLRTGFTSVATGTVEPFYGFTLDGDGRYLLDDFTVTHNSGKTIVFAEIAHRLGLLTLIIAHREELLYQAADKFRVIDPTAIIGQVGAGRHEWGAPVTVASVQTISRPEYLPTVKRFGYQLVIIDECHHSAAAGYRTLLEALPDAFVVGVTATPDRLDKKNIETIFGEPVYSASIIDMVEQGYLCDLRAVAIRTTTSLDGLHTQAGDFKPDELEEVIDTPERNRRIVDAYLEHGRRSQALCFAVTVKHASHLTDAFIKAGVKAAMVSGETPPQERQRILHEYERGQLEVVSNCGVLLEGFDAPQTSCIIMARPTQSRALFVQAVGRGTRLAPGKQDCVILDITDNCLKHRLQPQTLSKVLEKPLLDGESVTEAKERELREREQQERKTKEGKRAQDLVINVLARMDWRRQRNGGYVLESVRDSSYIGSTDEASDT